MLIKEYRIPMPFNVNEYKVAQLYMIAKKSKLETEGTNSGVEIIKNEPYQDGPGGNGQYTDKNYYVEEHLPVWLRPFLPKALATVKEEAWNAYPYSKNNIYTPFLNKFHVQMESKYVSGGIDTENIFELDDGTLKSRIVEVVNFVKDKVHPRQYEESEDPLLYKSQKNQRGPLDLDWYEKALEDYKVSNNKDLMCVYKIVKVRFDQWPIQSRIENFIQDYVRRTLVSAHRQAWAWQDEWCGLTMEDIRQMESDLQQVLAERLKKKSSTSASTATLEPTTP